MEARIGQRIFAAVVSYQLGTGMDYALTLRSSPRGSPVSSAT